MTMPEPPEPPLHELSAFVGATRPARSRKERIEMTTPEPSPLLTEKELDSLDRHADAWAEAIRAGLSDNAQITVGMIKRLVAQARAARPSPWQKVTRVEVIAEWGRAFTQWDCHLAHTDSMFQDDGRTLKLFVKNGQLPSPPAQDGGRP